MRRLNVHSYNNSHRLHLAIEGIDGTGKSTALYNTGQILQDSGLTVSTVHYTQKSGIIGKAINGLYQPDVDNRIVRRVRDFRLLQAALYGANGRANLLKRQRGTDILLTDRSILSGYASHIGRIPTWLVSAAESTLAPDVIAYLELPIDEASKRINTREEGAVGYEETEEELRMFSADYEKVMQNPPRRLRQTFIERVDAQQDPMDLARSIAHVALSYLA